MRHQFAIAFISLAASPAAGDLRLAVPVDCTLGTDCYIQQGVDHDPTEGISDFQCGSLTYDGHTGTDFALPYNKSVFEGVTVVASAPGLVVGARNDMPDILQVGPDAPEIGGRECGNGVVVSHGNGWETQYCHLARGSVTVEPGDVVRSGQPLGLIGLSGLTQFPHVDFTVRKDGKTVDPFAPEGIAACDSAGGPTLWRRDISMPPGGLIGSGFSDGVPEYETIKQGDAAVQVITADTPLVLWAFMFGGRTGDAVHLRIFGPDGHVMDETAALDATQAQLYRAVGRKAPDKGWPAGTYIGEVQMIRDGIVLDAEQTMVFVR